MCSCNIHPLLSIDIHLSGTHTSLLAFNCTKAAMELIFYICTLFSLKDTLIIKYGNTQDVIQTRESKILLDTKPTRNNLPLEPIAGIINELSGDHDFFLSQRYFIKRNIE